MQNSILQSLLNNIQICNPLYANKKITFIPIKSYQIPKLNYISIEQAHKMDKVHIKELNEEGVVQEIFIINKADQFILIPQGETLVGAKQNRIVNTSILLEPNSESKIPVSCIESGRWRYRKPNFEPSNEYATYKLRKHALKTVSKNFESPGFRSDQTSIWNFIDNEFRKENLYSETSSYTEFMTQKLADIDTQINEVDFPPDTNGFVTYFGERILSFEYFSRPDVFKDNSKRLIKAVLVDSIDYEKMTRPENFDFETKTKEKIIGLSTLKLKSKKSIAAGIDFKAIDEEKDINLSFISYEEEIIHLVTYF